MKTKIVNVLITLIYVIISVAIIVAVTIKWGSKELTTCAVVAQLVGGFFVLPDFFKGDNKVMTTKDRDIKVGDYVVHFKREVADDFMHIYKVLVVDALHTETNEELVVYRAMYGEGQVFVRPKSMFFEKVDKEKYPNAKQEYRLEKIADKNLIKQLEDYEEAHYFSKS